MKMRENKEKEKENKEKEKEKKKKDEKEKREKEKIENEQKNKKDRERKESESEKGKIYNGEETYNKEDEMEHETANESLIDDQNGTGLDWNGFQKNKKYRETAREPSAQDLVKRVLGKY